MPRTYTPIPEEQKRRHTRRHDHIQIANRESGKDGFEDKYKRGLELWPQVERLVAHTIRQMANSLPLEDREDIYADIKRDFTMTLLPNWDESRGAISTYVMAACKLKSRIAVLCTKYKNNGVYFPPAWKHKATKEAKAYQFKLDNPHATDQQVAEHAGVSERQARFIRGYLTTYSVSTSLDAPLTDDGKGNLHDTLEGTTLPTGLSKMIKEEDILKVKQILEANSKQGWSKTWKYLLGWSGSPPMNQAQIARKMKITRQAVGISMQKGAVSLRRKLDGDEPLVVKPMKRGKKTPNAPTKEQVQAILDTQMQDESMRELAARHKLAYRTLVNYEYRYGLLAKYKTRKRSAEYRKDIWLRIAERKGISKAVLLGKLCKAGIPMEWLGADKVGKGNNNRGRKLSPETREKIRQKAIERAAKIKSKKN